MFNQDMIKSNLIVSAILFSFLASCGEKKNKDYKYPMELAPYACYLKNNLTTRIDVETFPTKFIAITHLPGEELYNEKFAILISFSNKDRYNNYSDVSFFRLIDTAWTLTNVFTIRTGVSGYEYSFELLGKYNCFVLRPFSDTRACEIFAFDEEKKSVNKINKDYFFDVKSYNSGFLSTWDTFPQKSNNLPIAYHVSEEYYNIDSTPPKLVSGDYKKLKGNLLINEYINFENGYRKYDTVTIEELEKARSIVSKWQE